jgi:hypothetical protein
MNTGKQYFSIVITMLFVLTLSANTHAQNDKRALLIGINTYEIPGGAAPAIQPEQAITSSSANRAASSRGWTSLRGTVNDVMAMKNVLITRFGFKDENITVLLDEEASRDNILAALQTVLIDETNPGDDVFFLYAGHGSQVYNSLSNEPNRLDETIVPADANRGAADIRDKELRVIFNDAIDAGARLTLIFDSCHSGSIARGMPGEVFERKIAPVMVDIQDGSLNDIPAPEDRGALVISSAQDFQTAGERKNNDGEFHGIFSDALVRTLMSVTVDEPVEYIFSRVKAIMQSDGRMQEPVLGGLAERTSSPLFGDADELDGKIRIPVLRAESSSYIVLQGGISVGLYENTEITQITDNDNPVVLRVTDDSELSQTVAELVSGDISNIEPGTFFEITRPSIPNHAGVKIYAPVTNSGNDAILQSVKRIHSAVSEAGIQWITDPVTWDQESALTLITWENNSWMLYEYEQEPISLGTNPSESTIAEALENSTGITAVYTQLPINKDILNQFGFSDKSPERSVRLVDEKNEAEYILSGNYDNETDNVSYSWIRPNMNYELAVTSTIPARTDWYSISDENLVQSLEERIERVARMKSWLQLPSPPGGGDFPYRLGLKNASTGEIVTSGHLSPGEQYGLVIFTEQERISPFISSRYVYVFAIDNTGNSTLLFPLRGTIENRVPYRSPDQTDIPSEVTISPENLLRIDRPYAVNTIVMLSTDQAIPNPRILEFDGVITRSAPSDNPLVQMITDRNAASRNLSVQTPASWSIDRVIVTSGQSPLTDR